MTESPSTALAPAGAPVPVARPILDPDSMAVDLWTSLPESDWPAIIRLMQGKSTPLAEMIGKEVSVRHILAHRVESVDKETGEVLTLDRIVLLTPAGVAYQCVSTGIRRSLQLLMHYAGTPPWEPALRVVVEQQSTRSGFRTFTLQPVAEAAAPAKAR